jgi:plasmid replication initiation protein
MSKNSIEKPKRMLIEKRNCLNELRSNHMTLQEARFLCIYLAKINPRDPQGTRLVRFSLNDFIKIMDIQGHFSETYVKNTTDGLLQKIVSVPNEVGGYSSFQLFKECTVSREDIYSDWYVEIDAHDKALPLMFDFQRNYLTYELWNVLQLKSINQVRMYEILKQYEKIGERTLKIEDLKALLGIEEKEYPRFERFKVKVLDSCQEALKEFTDIKFEWEVAKRGQRGGKVLEIRFIISKNDEYKDVLNLDMFLKNYAYKSPQNPYLEHLEQTEQFSFETELPPIPQSETKKQNSPKNTFGIKKSLENEPLEPPITQKDIEYAQNHKLWHYAKERALNNGVHSPVPYATRIILTWDSKGYKSRNDLILKGEIKGQLASYDLDLVGNGVI